MAVSSASNDLSSSVASSQPAPLITRREVVSAPTSVIQVERISISEAHEAAIAAAIRKGRTTADK